MKRLIAAAAAAAVILGLAYLPIAGASTGHNTSTAVKTKTIAKGAANELRVGQKLKAPKLGKVVKRYQWLRCGVKGKSCKAIKGATHRTYVIRSADVGHVLRVREALQGNTIATSQPTAVVGLPLPVNTAIPTIADGGPGSISAPLVGDTLTGSNGTWTNAISFTYQWDDCNASGTNCVAISGATTPTYTIQQSDVGSTIEFVVTAYNYQVGG
ncbi:MAG TPA: hypothetical protein VLV86_03880 [Vicinamibacterales bacterium]|nr:hypothetical protein [Vicinamibacterales bacterium]